MSIEDPISLELTLEQWEELKERAKHLFDLGMGIYPNASASLQHIIGNLCNGLSLILHVKTFEKTRENYDRISEYAVYVEKYLKLLDDFPEFKEREMANGRGFFPDHLEVTLQSRGLVDYYEQELRGSSK